MRVTGYLEGSQGRITGIIDVDEAEARRLIRNEVAVPVDPEDVAEPGMEMEHAIKVMSDQSRQIEGLSEEIRSLRSTIETLTKEKGQLSDENVALAERVITLQNEIENLKAASAAKATESAGADAPKGKKK